jgi:hypothetical protein
VTHGSNTGVRLPILDTITSQYWYQIATIKRLLTVGAIAEAPLALGASQRRRSSANFGFIFVIDSYHLSLSLFNSS